MTPREEDLLFNLINELLDRVTRLETRLVKLMLAQGVDPHNGGKIDNGHTKE